MSYYIKNDKYFMDFKDEDGNKVTLEIIAEIFLEEIKYLILGTEDSTDESSFVVREDSIEGKLEYNFLEDDEEFTRVKKEYKRIIYG